LHLLWKTGGAGCHSLFSEQHKKEGKFHAQPVMQIEHCEAHGTTLEVVSEKVFPAGGVHWQEQLLN
jgi:hypothetical protein